jgi:hypothetical protein
MEQNLTKDKVLENLNNAGYKAPSNTPTTPGIGGALTSAGVISQNGTDPITATSLQPVQSLKLAPATLDTSSAGLATAATAVKDTYTTQRDAEIARLQEDKKNGASDIGSLIESIGDQESKKSDLYAANGVDTLQSQINEISSQIDANDLATRRRIEEITKSNPNGLVGSGAQGEIERIQRENASKNADLAIVLAARTKQYDTAKSIIDRKIDADTSAMKIRLDSLKFFYDENKDQLSKKESETVNERIKKQEQEYNDERDFKKQIGDLQLQAAKDGNMALFGALSGVSDEKGLSKAILNNTNNPYVTGTVDPNYKTALSVILGSDKFTKEQKTSITNAINSGDDPFAVIKNQTKNIMGQTLATDLGKAEIAKDQLINIDSLLKQYYANGGDTGIFKGNYENVMNRLGKVSDPDLVGLATNIALAMQNYRLSVTGTAASIQEDARIENVFPGINKTEGLNKARTDALIKSFDTRIDSAYRNTIGSSYDKLKEANKSVPDIQKAEEAAKSAVFDLVKSDQGLQAKVRQMLADGKSYSDINQIISGNNN